MEIEILQLIPGARAARGVAVVIDVFRAFSVACYVTANGAEKIFAVGNLEVAYALQREYPTAVLMGERHGERQPGFAYGNSPTEIEQVNFAGRTVIHTTSAGTQGIANAVNADEVITGAFVNAAAVVAYLQERDPARVSLVCMGREAEEPTDEDTLCAEFIRDTLAGHAPDFERIREHLRGYHSARKFFDREKQWAPERDFDLCLALNRFPFVLRATRVREEVSALTMVG